MSVSKTLLRRFRFFELLSPADYTRIARAAERRDLRANTLIFQEGALGDEFYLIVSGEVEIFTPGEQGDTILNHLSRNEWFGELALLDDLPRSASARTKTRTTLVTIPKAEFRWLVQNYPLVLHRLVEASHQALRDRDRAFRIEAEMQAARLGKLYAVALDITRHLDRDQALEAIRDHAIELSNSAGGDLYLYDSASQQLVAHMGNAIPAPKHFEGRVGRASGTKDAQPLKQKLHPGCYELDAAIRIVDPKEGERLLGVLNVYRADDGKPYEPMDKTLMDLFASQAAIVIDNANLYQTHLAKVDLDAQLNAARGVQQSLIPSAPPQIRGYQVAGLWNPAQQVSGDYYDFIPLSDGRWAFVIADVAGKGLNAALFMANTRSILRASAGAGGSAAEITGRANRAVSADSAGGMFVTAFIGILEPRTHRFTYVNAGHNLPIVYRAADRSLEDLPGGNLALGIVSEIEFRSSEITFAPNDLLVIYTDGVTEATDAHETVFGDEALHRAVKESGTETARRVIRYLDARVREFTAGFPQSDDITLVTLRRT